MVEEEEEEEEEEVGEVLVSEGQRKVPDRKMMNWSPRNQGRGGFRLALPLEGVLNKLCDGKGSLNLNEKGIYSTCRQQDAELVSKCGCFVYKSLEDFEEFCINIA